MRYYPICLDIRDKEILVIGGGKVAERKVIMLLECGGNNITLISPDVTEGIEELYNSRKIGYISGEYEREYIKDASIVFAATDNRNINAEIASEAKKRDILINVVDQPEISSFILPSVVKRGDLQISVSTSGKSPALAKTLREEIEKLFGSEYEIFLDILGGIRKRLLKENPSEDKRQKIFYDLVKSDILILLKEGRKEEAEDKAIEIMRSKDG
ncbi:MAG: bifunctional precorrin-2 dehydrogenase/sirohydrochlorin ferrochelatase [Nitrospirota bacterium]